MLTVDDVLARISAIVQPIEPVWAPVDEACHAILAQPVTMTDNSPPFDRAVVDGYAVRAVDACPGALLEIIAHIDAGGPELAAAITPGKCVGINTGAMVPSGADAVLMVEHTENLPDQRQIRVTRSLRPGDGIQRRGADALAGQVVLPAGTRLGPAQVAVCAAAGGAKGISVRRLKIAILTTGDELIDPTRIPAPGQIRNSNHPMLHALAYEALGAMGGSIVDLGTSGDDADEIESRLLSGLQLADLVIISGGMSMGTRDLAPKILQQLGAQFHVEKVKIKPGKPFLFATWQPPDNSPQKYIAGLPGNPVSSFVTFHRFVRPIISRLVANPYPTRLLTAITPVPLEPNGDREFYAPCTLTTGPSLQAQVLPWKGSADLFTLARATALLIRPANASALPAGSEVPVLSW